MNIRQEIEMEAVVHNRSIPSDVSEYMYEKNLDKLPDKYKYYSDSKQEYISIFDMQLHHFIRAFVLLQDTDKKSWDTMVEYTCYFLTMIFFLAVITVILLMIKDVI